MATQPFQMDAPPQPPDVQSQMGVPPGGAQGIGAAIAAKLKQAADAQQGQQGDQGGQPGQADPQGALLMRVQAIKAVLKEMAQMSPIFAPFANRIEQLLQTGVGEAISKGPGASPQPRDLTGSASPSEATSGLTFPG